MRREDPVTVLKGIGPKTAEHFAAAGIRTIGELTEYYPVRFEKYDPPCRAEDAADGQIAAVCGFVEKPPVVRRAGKMTITTARLRAEEGSLQAVWFNMPYLRSSLGLGVRSVFRGRIRRKGNTVTLQQPQVIDPEEYQERCRRLQPVYSLTGGLTNNVLRKAIRQALEGLDAAPAGDDADVLPEELRSRYQLASLSDVGWQMHFPEDEQSMVQARRRLAFEEFFYFLLTIRSVRRLQEEILRDTALSPVPETKQILSSLPYRLTGAQERAWQTIEGELTGRKVMNRLVQGDVGSGKTILAFLALVTAAANGSQGALMVPTEVLARQHYDAFVRLCQNAGIDCPAVLLTGSLTAKEKRTAHEKIRSGEARVVIGTHALIQDKVHFADLALVITDEQHRFGVRQREGLSDRGKTPHIMVMSATPIPRTLAVILFGDLDVTVIDEMPASRLPVKNCVVTKEWRPKAYSFIRREVGLGHQAYVVCPLVDASEAVDAENVTEYTQILRDALGAEIRVEMLHGKMKSSEKNAVMEAFARGEIQVLVSTTVIEVGVNVPNATVMMIENAERFGLAQLHQLRGRIGRGSAQSYCIFLCGQGNEENMKRLEILGKSNDGFEVARKDLGMRGPGDLLGVRQSGEAQFLVADIYRDIDILQSANEASQEYLDMILTNDSPVYRKLHSKLLSYQGEQLKTLNI